MNDMVKVNPAVLAAGFGDSVVFATIAVKSGNNRMIASLEHGSEYTKIGLGGVNFHMRTEDIRDLLRSGTLVTGGWGGIVCLELLEAHAPKKDVENMRGKQTDYRRNEKMFSRKSGKYVGTYQGFCEKDGVRYLAVRDESVPGVLLRAFFPGDIGRRSEVPSLH